MSGRGRGTGRGGNSTRGRGGNSNNNGDRNKDNLDKPKKKKESILDLSKFLEKKVHVKFSGGREVSGILKGFDPLLNLVLDHTIEIIRADSNESNTKGSDKTRELGLLVCRGPTVVLIHPEEEAIEISNPFLQQ